VPKFTGGFEQNVDAVEVGRGGRVRVEDGAVVVAFGGEVDDGVAVAGQIVHDNRVLDAPLEKLKVGVVPEVVEVVQVARVGQGVEGENAIVGIFVQHVADKIGADEPGGAGDEKSLHVFSLRG
jgi:hypothetical protein